MINKVFVTCFVRGNCRNIRCKNMCIYLCIAIALPIVCSCIKLKLSVFTCHNELCGVVIVLLEYIDINSLTDF